jgi:hypothetical protein
MPEVDMNKGKIDYMRLQYSSHSPRCVAHLFEIHVQAVAVIVPPFHHLFIGYVEGSAVIEATSSWLQN